MGYGRACPIFNTNFLIDLFEEGKVAGLETYYKAMGLDTDASIDDLQRKYAQYQETFGKQILSDNTDVSNKAKQNLAKLEKIYEILAEHMASAVGKESADEEELLKSSPFAGLEDEPTADDSAGADEAAAGPGKKSKMSGLSNFIGKAKTASGEVVAGTVEKSNQIILATITEIRALEPVLRRSGFIIGDTKISFPPAVTIVVEQVKDSKVRLGELTKSIDALSKVQQTIVKGLQKAYSMEDFVNPSGYTIGQIEIKVGFPPEISVHLNSQRSRSFG